MGGVGEGEGAFTAGVAIAAQRSFSPNKGQLLVNSQFISLLAVLDLLARQTNRLALNPILPESPPSPSRNLCDRDLTAEG